VEDAETVDDANVGDLAAWLTREHTRLATVWFGSRRYLAKDVDAFLAESHGVSTR
jgi:hypothetical protein